MSCGNSREWQAFSARLWWRLASPSASPGWLVEALDVGSPGPQGSWFFAEIRDRRKLQLLWGTQHPFLESSWVWLAVLGLPHQMGKPKCNKKTLLWQETKFIQGRPMQCYGHLSIQCIDLSIFSMAAESPTHWGDEWLGLREDSLRCLQVRLER